MSYRVLTPSLNAVFKANPAANSRDPYIEAFIEDFLGEAKWRIFSSQLAQDQSIARKSKGVASLRPNAPHEAENHDAPRTINFLVKVEIVKFVLRSLVPPPQSRRKSLVHPCPSSPSGCVTLSRSDVLDLGGWSSTQFRCWARRIEAISVFATLDTRLNAIAVILDRVLREKDLLFEAPRESSSQHVNLFAQMYFSPPATQEGLPDDMDPETWVKTCVSGKGLDQIINDAKARYGASPFLRGRYSNLEPFEIIPIDYHALEQAQRPQVAAPINAPAPTDLYFQEASSNSSLSPMFDHYQDLQYEAHTSIPSLTIETEELPSPPFPQTPCHDNIQSWNPASTERPMDIDLPMPAPFSAATFTFPQARDLPDFICSPNSSSDGFYYSVESPVMGDWYWSPPPNETHSSPDTYPVAIDGAERMGLGLYHFETTGPSVLPLSGMEEEQLFTPPPPPECISPFSTLTLALGPSSPLAASSSSGRGQLDTPARSSRSLESSPLLSPPPEYISSYSTLRLALGPSSPLATSPPRRQSLPNAPTRSSSGPGSSPPPTLRGHTP